MSDLYAKSLSESEKAIAYAAADAKRLLMDGGAVTKFVVVGNKAYRVRVQDVSNWCEVEKPSLTGT